MGKGWDRKYRRCLQSSLSRFPRARERLDDCSIAPRPDVHLSAKQTLHFEPVEPFLSFLLLPLVDPPSFLGSAELDGRRLAGHEQGAAFGTAERLGGRRGELGELTEPGEMGGREGWGDGVEGWWEVEEVAEGG